MFEPAEDEETAPNHFDRRGFFRGAAALTVGGFGAAAEVATPEAQTNRAAPELADAAEQLEKQTDNALRWIGRDPADWVRPRAGVDHNVVIVGGGQSGLSIAYLLRRKGVGRVTVIDRAAPGETGIWRTIARMQQLRTPKTLAGPELGNAALSFRAWYETQHGTAAFDALDRIARTDWADYLDWFQRVTGTMVRYRTRLLEIEPQGDLLRLHLESDGVPRTETARKVVLANGYAGIEPPPYVRLREAARSFPSDEALAAFAEKGVRYVVLHRAGYGPNKSARIERDLPRFGARLLEVARFDDGDVVYELQPGLTGSGAAATVSGKESP